MGKLIAGDRVRHTALGWIGKVQTTRPAKDQAVLVEVKPDQGHAARWFQEDEFTRLETLDVPLRLAGSLDPRERYLTDPAFHRLVDVLLSAIQGAVYTPTEIREAAMLAQIIYEERSVRRPIMAMDKPFPGFPKPSDPRD